MLANNLKLNAIVWKANCAGKSYGMFCLSLTDEEKEKVYFEYEQILEKRQQEEEERLRRAKEIQLASATKKKKNKKSPPE